MSPMDIEHGDTHQASEDGSTTDADASRQIILPGDALPGVLHVIPQEHRPFFPGQAVPLLMSAELWGSTFRSMQERKENLLGLVCTFKPLEELPKPSDFHSMGTVCRVHRIQQHEGQLQVLLEGLQRFRIRNWISGQVPYVVQAQYFPDPPTEHPSEVKAYAVAIINIIKELIPLNPLYGEELKVFLARSNPNEPSLLADFAAAMTSASKDDLQAVLETLPLLARLEKTLELLQREVEIARTQMEIRQHVEKEIQGHQREALLKQQLAFIQKELGITKDDRTAEVEAFKERIAELDVPEHARKRIDEELHKLSLLEMGSPEFGVTRNYLDWLTSIPWGVQSTDVDNLPAARKALNASHEGLEDIKDRIIEFLAVTIMKGEVGGSIVTFVGPPGVGKTSLGRSIANAMGRRFYRFSVGGMRDEAEIKGHRRTYIGAMPGKLVQALKDAGTVNPVIMLDEVDKIGSSWQGDPASALLEVLDPEQNAEFHDHYLDVDIDLSKVLFICTANQLDSIPAPLLDRMDVIHLSGYLTEEKLAIASRHLLPRQRKRTGLSAKQLRIDKAALRYIIEHYAREAGVRRLEKQLATIARKSVVHLLEHPDDSITVRKKDVPQWLGKPEFELEQIHHGVGIVTGLAWTAAGGATLPIEATRVHHNRAGLQMTGQLGDVMKESASIALSYVTSNAQALGVPDGWFDNAYIHLHVPAGATPKDGPSAGITMGCALLSLARGQAPRRGVAMTGELTLTGAVYPIGGVREKLVAARRQNIRTVILPKANERDYEQVPEHVREGLTAYFVARFEDVVKLMFD